MCQSVFTLRGCLTTNNSRLSEVDIDNLLFPGETKSSSINDLDYWGFDAFESDNKPPTISHPVYNEKKKVRSRFCFVAGVKGHSLRKRTPSLVDSGGMNCWNISDTDKTNYSDCILLKVSSTSLQNF